jgi:hypothetical protein
MNKIITLALAVSLLIGCKKSENDPGLSFRSRDKKIVGEWTEKLAAMGVTIVSLSDNNKLAKSTRIFSPLDNT